MITAQRGCFVSDPSEAPTATTIPPAVATSVADSDVHSDAQVRNETVPSLLTFVVLITLMWVISSAVLADKRPMAIRGIAKPYHHRNTKENKKDG